MNWRRTSGSDVEFTSARVCSTNDTDEKNPSGNYEVHDYQDEFEDHEDCDDNFSRLLSSPMHATHSKAFSNRSRRNFMLRLPPSLMKWVCLGIAAALVLFVMSLVKMSWDADNDVKIANMQGKLRPKPPAWEEFPKLSRYWGGLRSLVSYNETNPEYPSEDNGETLQRAGETNRLAGRSSSIPDSIVFDPYPNYASSAYTKQFGRKVDCYLDETRKVVVPQVRAYEGRVKGFPEPVIGSAEVLGMRHDICYERFGRLGPYGLGYSELQGGTGAMTAGDRDGADSVWAKTPEVDFRNINWRDIQDRCFLSNSHRFNTSVKPPSDRFRSMYVGTNNDWIDGFDNVAKSSKKSSYKPGQETVPRTAVVLRTWFDYQFTQEDLMFLRSMVSELGLLSGGEYSLHFLVHVKDENLPIWSDDATYQRVLSDSLPKEFHGMGTLWSEKQMSLMYPGLEETFMRDLPVHGEYRSTFMPMQYFAHQHPEYDFFWNWEMDVRNTGHWYHLFDSVSKWAKKQPRKYLWERNSRFYVPSEHGTWEDFSHTVRVQTEHGTNSANNLWSGLSMGLRDRPSASGQTKPAKIQGDKTIWGPERPQDDDVVFEEDVEATTPFANDKYEWGVGEDADLITFNPLFDPDSTTWLLAEDTTGYNKEHGQPPRRSAIITASRLSRRLLMTMHQETSTKRHTMFSEMWPASCALHHGLKAVYAPHAEYVDRKWPTKYLEGTFNAGRNGATGGSRTSVFGDREHNFRGTTWYYNAEFSETLWHRWLGMSYNNDGGEEFERSGEGRMCLPGMLLHPVKRVDLPREGEQQEELLKAAAAVDTEAVSEEGAADIDVKV